MNEHEVLGNSGRRSLGSVRRSTSDRVGRARTPTARGARALGLLIAAAVTGLVPRAGLAQDTAPAAGPSMIERAEGDMVLVTAGSFYMGCNERVDSECYDDEKPGRTVTVAKFWIDRLEVTVADYKRCVQAGRCSADGLTMPYVGGKNQPKYAEHCNWGKGGREQHPMNCVDWHQARSYCEWSGKRLPSEAEWEKASRGRDGRKYPWGNGGYGSSGRVANIADESARHSELFAGQSWTASGYDDGWVGTAPVGSFPAGASPYGAQDMMGNVWEWVESEFGDARGIRGGSWDDRPRTARASNRFWLEPRDRRFNVGFRCAQ